MTHAVNSARRRAGSSRGPSEVPAAPSTPCPNCGGSGQVEDFGALIRAKRRELGMTQFELAEKIGVWSPTTVCHWEKGHSNPKPAHRRKLREVLGL